MSTHWVVYVLSDPVTKERRYVGRTCQPLSARLSKHKTTALRKRVDGTWYYNFHRATWFRWLIEQKRWPPQMDVLEEGVGNASTEAEIRWIAKLKKEGCNLVNATAGGEGGAIRTHPVHNTPERIAAVKRYYEAHPEARAEHSKNVRSIWEARRQGTLPMPKGKSFTGRARGFDRVCTVCGSLFKAQVETRLECMSCKPSVIFRAERLRTPEIRAKISAGKRSSDAKRKILDNVEVM